MRRGAYRFAGVLETARAPSRRATLTLSLAGLLWAQGADAGPTFKIDDTKWAKLGVGARGSFAAREDGAGTNGDEWSKDFNLDNARIYLSGQIHQYVKLEVNTECVFCGDGDLQEFVVLDAIGKLEFTPYFNIWGGRLLVPSDRAEMDGPFYANVYEGFKTPFYPSDFSVQFGSGGAGVYGRDHGVNLWGNAGPEGRLKYVFGAFNGLRGLSNPDDNPLFGVRLAYQFLGIEDNPAYYTSSTYYGGGGDVLTVGYALQYQADGSGSALHPGDFLGTSVDVLFEKPLGDAGAVTVEGEYKYFDSDYDLAAFSDEGGCFCMFDGDAFTATALYLLPAKVGIGKFQPYVRYTDIEPDHSSSRDEFESGVNYVIDGHNARLSLYFQHGDLATKSLVNFAPDVTGDDVSAVKIAIQLQI
ncbi:MAG: hypothetical protein QOD06_670 [Candidatus Binatota bacterium]|nr:hypothetical protein [Candidatus Binatota bacterium]